MRAACRAVRQAGQSLGLVPTLGALHAGHISLVRAARQKCDTVAATIFVNPTQFAPGEDFAKYPRTFDQDRALLEAARVSLLFAPAPEEMYPEGASTVVDVADIGARLDGVSRPGHFRGVATIVAKLFHIVAPHQAFFGQKDAAQVAVLRRMVRDLNFDLELVVCPTVREADGLALSSRNRYLSPSERASALTLSRTLDAISEGYRTGERSTERLLALGRAAMAHSPEVRLDYLSVVDAETLLALDQARSGALVAIAAWVGPTRLIDNLIL
jgi:pantoate--beta-alanine ligase